MRYIWVIVLAAALLASASYADEKKSQPTKAEKDTLQKEELPPWERMDVDSLKAVLDTLDIEKVFERAAKWEVRANKKLVRAARAELKKRGYESLNYIFGEKYGTGSGLAYRANKETIDSLKIEAEPYIIGCFGDNPPWLLATSARYVGELKYDAGYDTLLALLSDTTEERRKVRNSVIRALGDFGNPDAAPLIEPFLADTSEYTRIRAVIALGKLENKRSLEPIACTALFDSLFTVRQAALGALRHFGRKGIATIARLAKADRKNSTTIIRFIQGLPRLKSDKTRSKVLALLKHYRKDKNPIIRGYAIMGIEKVSKKKVKESKEKDPFVRWAIEQAQ